MFYKKRDKKAEPALGAASENAVAAVNENEIATGENGLESSSVAAQSRRQKAFRIFAAITCTLCGLLWAAFFFVLFCGPARYPTQASVLCRYVFHRTFGCCSRKNSTGETGLIHSVLCHFLPFLIAYQFILYFVFDDFILVVFGCLYFGNHYGDFRSKRKKEAVFGQNVSAAYCRTFGCFCFGVHG